MSLPLARRETPSERASLAEMRLLSMEAERWRVFRWARAVRHNTGGLSIAACTRQAALERIDFLMEYNDALMEVVRAQGERIKELGKKERVKA
jgi:hypothetical protein